MLKRLFKKGAVSEFSWRADGDHVIVTLKRGGELVPVAAWAEVQPEAAALVEHLIGDDADGDEGLARPVIAAEDSLTLSPQVVAALDVSSAALLGLPAPTPLALDLRPLNRIDQDDFRITVRWVKPGGQPVRTRLNGAILTTEAGPRRIPEPLFSLQAAAVPLTQPLEKAERFEALAGLRAVWPDDPQLAVETEPYLQDLRVHYASGLSLKLKTLTPDRTEFDPVLFSSSSLAQAGDDGQAIDEEADNLLSAAAQKLFASDRFKRDGEARPVYVLRNGEYVFIDPALRPALSAVRQLQDAPEAERRAFILNPRKVLRTAIGDKKADEIGLDRLFVDTEQFSARVAGVDIWRAPVLPWLVPSSNNTWLPERFGLRIGEDYFVLPAEHVKTVVERVEEAAVAGAPTADVTGLLEPSTADGPPPPPHIAVTEQSRAALRHLAPFVYEDSQRHEVAAPAELDGWDAATRGKLFLVVRDNFDAVEYAPLGAVADEGIIGGDPIAPPPRLRTVLKGHQVEGLNWLASGIRSGRPGALLADDMGLGKTLQAIAFMAWLRDEVQAGRQAAAPFLVVAPTGLLGTWRDEIAKHLDEPRLGSLIPAFGGNLKLLREEDSFSARDVETGKASLDAAVWRDAGVVLTTYETLRDYHFSFARTRFGLIIYDEIQKLKNPGSQMTRAAKALNADFILGMTGTPVENRLQDLWSIMDVIAPGSLGSSRDFERKHPAEDRPALQRLKAQLTDPVEGRPPFMLRRLKSDVLDGMPTKTIHALEAPMPSVQANTYRDLVIRAAAAGSAGTMGKGGMLTTLSRMRGVSLHPLDPRHAPPDLDAYASDSARLSQTLTILDRVAQANEKALIFVEDLAMQERLAGLIHLRFNLSTRPTRINGTVPGHKRQALVELFQRPTGRFDVMILSPKAGGVGLTLTAANHVIHLSRWWNPAVEDQATDRVFRIGQTRDVHVYLPLAVHPDPDLAPSSFDLRLNALIDRKRKLTRDLFLPPDASEGELSDLFREVSLERPVDIEADLQDTPRSNEVSPTSGAGSSSQTEGGSAATPDNSGADEGRAVEDSELTGAERRPTLTLSAPVAQAGIKLWRRGPGEDRPTAAILALFDGKHISHVVIRDPYSLVTHAAREAQIRFLADLKQSCRALECVTIEYAPEIDGDLDDMSRRREFGAAYTAAFLGAPPRLSLTRRNKRSRDDDFHDRFIEIDVRHAGDAIKRHELTIGRGAEALYDLRKQCTVTYAPPGGAVD